MKQDRAEYIETMSYCVDWHGDGGRCERVARALARCDELEARVQELQEQLDACYFELGRQEALHSRQGRLPDYKRYDQINAQLAAGLSIRAAARACHCSPSTVQRCIAYTRRLAAARAAQAQAADAPQA